MEWINDLEGEMVEITVVKQYRRMKRNKDNLRELWDNIKCTNIPIIDVSEERTTLKKYLKR